MDSKQRMARLSVLNLTNINETYAVFPTFASLEKKDVLAEETRERAKKKRVAASVDRTQYLQKSYG
jgi:hypothetical protein